MAFSPALTAALRCNVDLQHLGSMVQAKGACFYLVKYLTKDGLTMGSVLSLCKAAFDHVIRHPSVADNTGTETRTSQHLLTRLLNSVNGKVEVSGTLATLALLGVPSNYYSHDYWWCHVRPALSYAKRAHALRAPTILSLLTMETERKDSAASSALASTNTNTALELSADSGNTFARCYEVVYSNLSVPDMLCPSFSSSSSSAGSSSSTHCSSGNSCSIVVHS